MLPALIIFALLASVFGPQLWVRHVMQKYSADIDSMPGTGGELVIHLANRFGLKHLSVEITDPDNDHYNPDTKTICLSENHYQGKSLTAITIAAHEFGHSLQHAQDYQPLVLRTRLARFSLRAQRLASFLLVSLPFSMLLVKIPLFHVALLASGLTIMLLPILLHLITLPVEFDASFNRALPVLENGNYLPPSAMPAAKKILTAAALTYVAASLASLLNFYRWIAILRR